MTDEISLEEKFGRLRMCLSRQDEKGVQDAIFALSAEGNDRPRIPDEVAEQILTLLENEGMYKSQLAAHLLNFFRFESSRLSDRAKWLCIVFLNAHGDEFLDVYSQQVVIELRYGTYGDPLRMKKPNPQQWKDYEKMKGSGENQ